MRAMTIDKSVFNIVSAFDNSLSVIRDHSGNYMGMTVNSECAFTFSIKQDISRFENVMKYLVKNDEERYVYYPGSEHAHFILDKETRNKIQVGIDPDQSTMVVYPFKNCVGRTIADFISLLENAGCQIEFLKTMSWRSRFS